jgi:hypothetical protein
MFCKSKTVLAAALLLVVICACAAGQQPAEENSGADAVSVAASVTAPPLTDLLPDSLAGNKATSEAVQYGPEALEQLVGATASIFREYKVVSAASRAYGTSMARVDVFRAQNVSGAFGLFTFNRKTPISKGRVGLGPDDCALADNAVVLWHGNVLVLVRTAATKQITLAADLIKIANAISGLLSPDARPGVPPTLLESLPAQAGVRAGARYFLGPQSLGDYLPHAADMFGFNGEAEAVLADYQQRDRSRIKLLIVEYNTPQFAHEALERANEFVSSLAQDEQSKIIVKRTGNYIIEAGDVTDRVAAQQLVDSVKYPYTVKWFQTPYHRKEDPHAGQKAAQIMISSFGIVALLLSSALMGGGVFGTIIFLKRRKQQRQVFSDAGGMLRLDIEELCTGVSQNALPGGAGSVPGGREN